ncbi:hypothetical protein D3C85_775460 [compost metagenome]
MFFCVRIWKPSFFVNWVSSILADFEFCFQKSVPFSPITITLSFEFLAILSAAITLNPLADAISDSFSVPN